MLSFSQSVHHELEQRDQGLHMSRMLVNDARGALRLLCLPVPRFCDLCSVRCAVTDTCAGCGILRAQGDWGSESLLSARVLDVWNLFSLNQQNNH